MSGMTREETIEVRVSAAEKEAIRDAARRAERSVSDWVRLVVAAAAGPAQHAVSTQRCREASANATKPLPGQKPDMG